MYIYLLFENGEYKAVFDSETIEETLYWYYSQCQEELDKYFKLKESDDRTSPEFTDYWNEFIAPKFDVPYFYWEYKKQEKPNKYFLSEKV